MVAGILAGGIILAVALFAFLGGVFQTRSGNGLAPAAEWLRTEKMRAGYGVPLNETVLSKMQDSKMNAIIYPVRYFDGGDPEQVNKKSSFAATG